MFYPAYSRFLRLNRTSKIPGSEYRMEGYKYEQVGPIKFEGKGIEKMEKETAELMML